jgi:hypothetical protein
MMISMRTESQAAIAGDWHNDIPWIMNVFSRISTWSPHVRTILHLGDLEVGNDKYAKSRLNFIDERCRGTGIKRVLVTPGNHDNWDRMQQRTEWAHGQPTPLSEFVWCLPPGFRFDFGGKQFLSFGGAASVQDTLIEGKNFWPGEVRPHREFEAAAHAGHADVMLTHEAVDAGLPRVLQRTSGPGSRPMLPERRDASARSRQLVTDLWNEVQPDVLFHGHMHVRDQLKLPDGRRVYSLADNRERLGNIGVLDVRALEWSWH